MRLLPAALAAIVTILTLSGCQSAYVSRSKAIDAALYSYEKTIRWQGPREGYRFLRPDLQPAYLPAWIDSIRIVGYEVLDSPVEIEENRVVQRVRIQYVNQDTQVIHTVMDEQQWETADDGKTWQRTNPVPSYQ